jgi:two-component system LytT family sensor kinase
MRLRSEYLFHWFKMIEFYICFLWVYPYYLKRKKIPQLLLGLMVAIGSFILMRYLIEEVIYLRLFGMNNYAANTTTFQYITDNLYFGSAFIVIPLAVYSAQQNFKDELMNRKLKAEATKAELAFLKSQINPHFLYNTLNYVYALAIPVSEKLSDAILRLSALMRYTLSESPDGKVKIAKEIEYLESFIALFKMRFEPQFYVEFKTEGWKKRMKLRR